MMFPLLYTAILFAGQAPAAQAPADAKDPYAKYVFSLAKPLPAPEVVIDVTDSPESKPWAEEAQKLVHDWFPHVAQLLATEDYTPPKTIKLIFKKGISAPAYTSGGAITANADWIAKHPDDFGMMIHELVHVVQSYPRSRNNPGWLVEGIADYIRWWRYEPDAPRTRINPERAKYTDSYRTTAAFLAWVSGKYDRTLVRRLDRSLRDRAYSDELFQTVTGKPVAELWTEFVATMR